MGPTPELFERAALAQRTGEFADDYVIEALLPSVTHPSLAPRVRLPRRLMFPVAYAAEAIARITGREPLITVDGLRMARYRMFFSSERAQRELGYHARPYVEGLSDAIEWFRVGQWDHRTLIDDKHTDSHCCHRSYSKDLTFTTAHQEWVCLFNVSQSHHFQRFHYAPV